MLTRRDLLSSAPPGATLRELIRRGPVFVSDLASLREAAQGAANLMPFILNAVRAYATLGEITDVFRKVFGVYQEPVIV